MALHSDPSRCSRSLSVGHLSPPIKIPPPCQRGPEVSHYAEEDCTKVLRPFLRPRRIF
jgi:hypothetical protein